MSLQREDDRDLLEAYVGRGSEDAFRALVERHVHLVHGAAWRLTRDAHLAEEISQAVFILLARKAHTLRSPVVLAGWLHRTTRFVALQGLRSERRRQRHHNQLAHMTNDSEANDAWNEVSPVLEDAISHLHPADRNAVILRFLEGQDIPEVARALGTSEAAAKMRVSRAVEKLRVLLGRRGALVSGTALLTALTAQGVMAAPPALSASAVLAALSSTSTPSLALNLVKETLAMTAWNKTRTVALAILVALLLAGGAFHLWIWAQHRPTGTAPRTAVASPPTITSFDAMDGTWAGSFEMRQGTEPPTRQETLLLITSVEGGRVCQIEMQVFSRGPDNPDRLIFTHSLIGDGGKVFTTSDPRTGRGNGEGIVTRSFENQSRAEWRAAMHFPFADGHGAMDALWHRQGNELHIASHDQIYRPDGTNHLYSDIRVRRRVEPGQGTAARADAERPGEAATRQARP